MAEATRATYGVATPQKRRILILDDSEVTCEALASILEDHDYPVEYALDLAEFETKLAEFEPEVILSDLQMPEMQGDEVCRTLKMQFATEGIPIILMSTLPDEELADYARRGGADGFLSKQHGSSRLMELVEELLEGIIF